MTHFHHWNDTNGENSPDGCVGKYGCNGGESKDRVLILLAFFPSQIDHFVILNAELPTTSISLENGTIITIPIVPGTQIDVAAGTINTSPDKDVQNDADVMDDVEDDLNESEMQNSKKPSDASAATKPHASPNRNGLNPFANQYLQYPNFAFNPNAPQFAQPQNFPQSQNYPHSSQFHQSPQNPHAFGASASSSPSSFPPHYFNQAFPNAPPRTLVVKAPHVPKGTAPVSNQYENNKDEPRVDGTENESQSNTESPASDSTLSTMPPPNIPQKNQEPSKNQIPSNYSPYFNYYNTFNPNQYYPNNFNGGKNPNIPQQYSAPNQQFNHFNPQYNPYNFQPPPNYYSNPQLSSNQGVMNSNKKKQKVKHRPNENENESTTESNTVKHKYNRRARPTTHKKIKPTHNENSHTTEETVEKIEVIAADKDFDSEE